MKILSSIALSLALSCALFGQQVTNGNRYFVPGTGVGSQVANDGTTGTTLNKLAKLNASGAAIITAITDVSGIEGVVVGNAGTLGVASIAKTGQAGLIFDGPTVAGDYVVQSTTLVGQGHDAGAICPSGSQVVGRVLSTNGSGGTFTIIVGTEGCGSSGGAAPAGTSQLQTSNSFGTAFTAVPNVAAGSVLASTGTGTVPVMQSKSVIDPRDYGVDCTDTTDSTTQWAAAVTAAGNYGKIVVPKGCLFRISGATGWSLYKVYGLEVEFSGRQGNACDNQGPNPAGIDYRQAYASGNKVVSIVDSQRMLIKNLTIYTNGGADTGIDIDQDLLTPPITTRDDFYNVCISNNTATRNSAYNGIRVSFTAISNVENIHFYHPDVLCSQSAPTSASSNGNAIYFGNNSNQKNEIVDDYRTTNCSQDIQDNFGSDLTWQFGLASNSYLNVVSIDSAICTRHVGQPLLHCHRSL
jgi:hypothetical protein